LDAPALRTLTEINIDDMLNAWGLKEIRFGRTLLRALCRPAAIGFARQILAFDAVVAQEDLHGGGRFLCRRFTGGVAAAGLAHIPAQGPLLILANHPGLTDTIALFAAIPRRDLRVIALDRPFLQAIPHTASRLFLLPDEPSARAGITRQVANYLKKGGAALTFPAGEIEPDPLVQPGAIDSLSGWSESIGLFARLVPQMQIVVAIAGGVFTPAALHHPLTRLRRKPKDRELMGASLQVAWKGYQKNIVRVAFSPPMLASDLVIQGSDPAGITSLITSAARDLLENWPPDAQPGQPLQGFSQINL
jgi:hypothetical protein